MVKPTNYSQGDFLKRLGDKDFLMSLIKSLNNPSIAAKHSDIVVRLRTTIFGDQLFREFLQFLVINLCNESVKGANSVIYQNLEVYREWLNRDSSNAFMYHVKGSVSEDDNVVKMNPLTTDLQFSLIPNVTPEDQLFIEFTKSEEYDPANILYLMELESSIMETRVQWILLNQSVQIEIAHRVFTQVIMKDKINSYLEYLDKDSNYLSVPRLVSSELVYDGWQKVTKNTYEDNKVGTYERELLSTPNGACILIVEDGHFIFVEQFRVGAGGNLIEIPAGVIDPGETALDTVVREALEETGRVVKDVENMGFEYYPLINASGISNIFVGVTDTVERNELGVGDENLKVHKISFVEAYDMLGRGVFKDSKTIIALLAFKLRLAEESIKFYQETQEETQELINKYRENGTN